MLCFHWWGLSLYGLMLSGAMGSITHMSLIQVLVFSAFIVAVDPVVVSCRFPFPQVLYSFHSFLCTGFCFLSVMWVRQFAFMCVCVCMCVCVYVSLCVSESVCFSCLHVRHMSEHVCLCRCVCQSMSVCMCDCVMCVCLFTSVYEHVWLCMCLFVCEYVWLHVSVYVCVCEHVCVSLCLSISDCVHL